MARKTRVEPRRNGKLKEPRNGDDQHQPGRDDRPPEPEQDQYGPAAGAAAHQYRPGGVVAKDNGGVYAIAQSMRADVGGYKAVTQSLDLATSTVDVALAAGEAISDLLVEMKEKALAGADSSLDTASRNGSERRLQGPARSDQYDRVQCRVQRHQPDRRFEHRRHLGSGQC
jgi:hypothetical protein